MSSSLQIMMSLSSKNYALIVPFARGLRCRWRPGDARH